MKTKSRSKLSMMGWGLLIVAAYVVYHHPPGWSGLGYSEDIGCTEIPRAMLADRLADGWLPRFDQSRWMAPWGSSMPYFAWAMEWNWVGAWVYRVAPEFPFLWMYWALSIFVTYLGVGWIARRMVADRVAWALALAVALFNVPRHFKTFAGFEVTPQHWIVLGVFYDAWIVHASAARKELRWSQEAWRLLLLLFCAGLSAHYWGWAILQWFFVRVGLGIAGVRGALRIPRVQWRKLRIPALIGAVYLGVAALWFWPWMREALKLGSVSSPGSWPAPVEGMLWPIAWDVTIRPLLEYMGQVFHARPFWQISETVVTLGWFPYLGLLTLGLAQTQVVRRQVVRTALPFIAFAALLVVFSLDGALSVGLRNAFFLLSFFRVACRTFLLLPPVLGAIALLCLAHRSYRPVSRRAQWVLAAVALAELPVLFFPTTRMSAPTDALRSLEQKVASRPGKSVLDLPFCVIGGNSVCADRRCSFYPRSTLGLFMTLWHRKSVAGAYFGRLTEAQCEQYAGEPFDGLFAAWRENRCPTPREWESLCRYLGNSEQAGQWAAIQVYPDVWTAAGEPSCASQIRGRLGAPFAEADLEVHYSRSPETAPRTRVWAFEPRCR